MNFCYVSCVSGCFGLQEAEGGREKEREKERKRERREERKYTHILTLWGMIIFNHLY